MLSTEIIVSFNTIINQKVLLIKNRYLTKTSAWIISCLLLGLASPQYSVSQIAWYLQNNYSLKIHFPTFFSWRFWFSRSVVKSYDLFLTSTPDWFFRTSVFGLLPWHKQMFHIQATFEEHSNLWALVPVFQIAIKSPLLRNSGSKLQRTWSLKSKNLDSISSAIY